MCLNTLHMVENVKNQLIHIIDHVGCTPYKHNLTKQVEKSLKSTRRVVQIGLFGLVRTLGKPSRIARICSITLIHFKRNSDGEIIIIT